MTETSTSRGLPQHRPPRTTGIPCHIPKVILVEGFETGIGGPTHKKERLNESSPFTGVPISKQCLLLGVHQERIREDVWSRQIHSEPILSPFRPRRRLDNVIIPAKSRSGKSECSYHYHARRSPRETSCSVQSKSTESAPKNLSQLGHIATIRT